MYTKMLRLIKLGRVGAVAEFGFPKRQSLAKLNSQLLKQTISTYFY